MGNVFEEDRSEAVLLVDASNAFNALNGEVALNNIKALCPIFHQFLKNWLLNGRTLVHLSSAADPHVSARTSGGPLAYPPGVLFAQTQADLLRTQKSAMN